MAWLEAASAGIGLAGGMLQSGQDERRGYGRAVKQQPYANALLGIGDQWAVKRALEDARKNGTPVDWAALRADAESKGLATGFLDLAQAGGIQGIRKQYQEKFLQNIEQGYAGASDALKGSAQEARSGVYGERQQGISDVQQSMQQAGLQSSNIAQQARANVSYQTSRALSQIDTQLGASLSDLKLSQAQATDAALARNLGLDEQTTRDLMSVLVANAGYGPYAGSTYFSSSGEGFQSKGINMEDVGAGAFDLLSALFPGA